MIIASLKQLEGNRKNYMQQKRRELRRKEVETQKESNNEFKLPATLNSLQIAAKKSNWRKQ